MSQISFTVVFQMLLCGECGEVYKLSILEQCLVCTPLGVNVFVTPALPLEVTLSLTISGKLGVFCYIITVKITLHVSE
jgi:hypothetical protein